MKNLMVCLSVIFGACVWREPLPPVCSRGESVTEAREVAVAILGSSRWNAPMLSDEILSACNMWGEVGIACTLADSEESADILVGFYTDAGCNEAGFTGSFGGVRGIWINDQSSCRPDVAFSPWLTHLVAHEMGHVFGVDDVPGFCNAGIMGSAIERYEPTAVLSALAESDKQAFGERYSSAFLDGDAVLDCGHDNDEPEEVPVSESVPCAGSVNSEAEVLSLWISPEVAFWQAEIIDGCSYWAPVNVSCESASAPEEADVVVRTYSGGCGIGGYAYLGGEGKYVFELNVSCLPEDTEKAERKVRAVSAHELGHTLGIIHVPAFCGEAVMNPILVPRTCLSDADIYAWQERRAP